MPNPNADGLYPSQMENRLKRDHATPLFLDMLGVENPQTEIFPGRVAGTVDASNGLEDLELKMLANTRAMQSGRMSGANGLNQSGIGKPIPSDQVPGFIYPIDESVVNAQVAKRFTGELLARYNRKDTLEVPCDECNGSGEYIGFTVRSTCAKCQGRKTIPRPGN